MYYGGVYNFAGLTQSSDLSTFHTWWWGVFLFQVCCHPGTWLTPNYWWKLDLVIPVSWLVIRLIILLVSNQWNVSFINHKFKLGWEVRVKLSLLTAVMRLWWLYIFREVTEEFEHGPDYIFMDIVDTLKLCNHYWVHTLILQSLGFLCSLSTLSDRCEAELAFNIKSHKLWMQARALPLLFHWQAECQPQNLLVIFLYSRCNV